MIFLLVSLLAQFSYSVNFGPTVTELTSNNFQKEVEHRGNNTVYFVMFHGQHCPACQMAYPEFIEAANEAAGMIKFGHVDTSSEYALGNQFRIYSIPHFIIFHPKGDVVYNRERSSRTMLNIASRYLPSLAEAVDETWIPSSKSSAPDEEHQSTEESLKAAILFTDKQNIPPIWSGISCAFHNSSHQSNMTNGNHIKNIRIGFSNNATIQKMFGITAVPTILMVNGKEKYVYNGKNKFSLIRKGIIDFFEGVISPSDTSSSTASSQPAKPTPPPILIHNLTSLNVFNEQCKGKGLFCVIVNHNEENNNSSIYAEFDAASKKYRHDHFRFYVCGNEEAEKEGKCPFDFIGKSVWIFHHRREAAIRVDDAGILGSTLDRVIDGGARFYPLDKLKNGEEL